MDPSFSEGLRFNALTEPAMGFATDLHCSECGYSVDEMVLGLDYGGDTFRQAVCCSECRELRMVRLVDSEDLHRCVSQRRPDYQALGTPLICPESPEHCCTAWYHPGPCPRCGSELRQGSRALLWDG